MPAERAAWVCLASVPGVGPVLLDRLRSHYGSLAGAIDALSRAGGRTRRLPRPLREGLAKRTEEAIVSATMDPDRTERDMTRMGGWIVTPFDREYQRWLANIEEPPLLLFGLGSREVLALDRSVAVVGTRHPTATGRALAARVAVRLAEARSCVVSGLAVGIDAAAHVGVLDAGGSTIAVIAGGLDQPGPVINRRLAERIVAEGGAIVSEHRPGVQPTRGTFPRRNRIISALTVGTVVIEAPARSGALITARHALEQGRRLVVAPGRPGDAATAGCLSFLRESPAVPLVGLDELIADLGLAADEVSTDPKVPTLSAEAALEMLSPVQQRVSRALMQGPRSADAIVVETSIDPGAVAAALTLLQIRGWAQAYGSVHLASGPLARGG